MKDFIKNELTCLRALETIGSDRYEELSKAINWVNEVSVGSKDKKNEPSKHKFAHTTIRWKDDGREEEAIISLNGIFDEKHDDEILFYCENEAEFEKLKEYDNGEDFEIIGCTMYTETI